MGLVAGQLLLILWAAAAGLQTSPARAQDAMTLEPGKRVRILAHSLGHEPVAGRLDAMHGDTLTLQPENDRFHSKQVVLDPESRVDVSIAHHNHAGRGLFMGGVIGLGLGAFIVSVQKGANELGSALDPQSEQKVSNGPMFAGAAIGAVVGAVVGSSITSDTWVTVRYPRPLSYGAAFGADGGHT